MAVNEYCSRHGPRLKCDCESPRMVHRCGFGECYVEIYNDNEMCARHEADTAFIRDGGPKNIVHPSKVEGPGDVPTWVNVLWALVLVAVVVFAGMAVDGAI